MWSLQLVPWVVFTLVYIHPTLVAKQFGFIPPVFTWGFNPFTEYGHVLHWNNTIFTSICAAVEIVFNIMSLTAVHKMRKSIQSVSTTENMKREVKLLIQCFILGMVFLLTDVLYTIVATMGVTTPGALLFVQYTWTTNHCINPVVYLTVNTKLRRRLLGMVTFGKYGTSELRTKHSQVRPSEQTGQGGSVDQRG